VLAARDRHTIGVVHTTPSGPIDVPLVFPPLAPFARTTVRLHPRPDSPTVEQSSMGGPLPWPADEAWPTCDGPEFGDHLDSCPGEPVVPLVPVLQLLADDIPELPFPAGTDVLQVLWCPFDHEPWSAPRPELRWRRRADVGARRQEMPVPDEEANPWHVPDPCVIDAERVIEYPTYDLPDAVWSQIRGTVRQVEQDTGWQYDPIWRSHRESRSVAIPVGPSRRTGRCAGAARRCSIC
jgi:hypothetical protein